MILALCIITGLALLVICALILWVNIANARTRDEEERTRKRYEAVLGLSFTLHAIKYVAINTVSGCGRHCSIVAISSVSNNHQILDIAAVEHLIELDL